MFNVVHKRKREKLFCPQQAHVRHRERERQCLVFGEVVDRPDDALRSALSFGQSEIELVIETAAPAKFEIGKNGNLIRLQKLGDVLLE